MSVQETTPDSDHALDRKCEHRGHDSRHLHRCQNCGLVWGHGNMMARDVEAHKCPRCGKTEWRQFSGLQNERPAPAMKSMLVIEADYLIYVRALLTVGIIVMGAVLLGELIAPWLIRKK